jgi:hypothetical protein
MMTEPAFDPQGLNILLTTMSPAKRLAFALGCAERLYPNYVAFVREQGWGDPEGLRAALDLAWCVLLGRSTEVHVVQELRRRIEDAEPETEDFQTILVSAALDAASAAGLILKLLEQDDPTIVVEIASLCRDTVDMYLQVVEELDPSDPAFETKILIHPLMQTELCRQRSDLEMLASVQWSEQDVRRLEKEWREPEVSNLGLRRR